MGAGYCKRTKGEESNKRESITKLEYSKWLEEFLEPHLQQDGCLGDSSNTAWGCKDVVVKKNDLMKLKPLINNCMELFWQRLQNKLLEIPGLDQATSRFQKIVKVLLNHGKADPSKKYDLGFTLLHGAVVSGMDVTWVKRLLELEKGFPSENYWASPLDSDSLGYTPDSLASVRETDDCLKAIEEAEQFTRDKPVNELYLWLETFLEPRSRQDGCLANSGSTDFDCKDVVVNKKDLLKLDELIDHCMVLLEQQRWMEPNPEQFDRAKCSFVKIVKVLISHGKASVEKQYRSGYTILHGVIASKMDIQWVNRLLEAGAPLDVTTSAGYTPLHLAVFHQEDDYVEAILEEVRNRGQPDIVDLTGPNLGSCFCPLEYSPLMTAAIRKHLKCVELLLAHGADVNFRFPHFNRNFTDGKLALHFAIETKEGDHSPDPDPVVCRKVLELLMKVTDVREVIRSGRLFVNPLVHAIDKGNDVFFELLENYRDEIDLEQCLGPGESLNWQIADPSLFGSEVVFPSSHYTALSYACLFNRQKTAEILLKLGAKCNESESCNRRQPLLSSVMFVLMSDDKDTPDDLFQLLMKHGANFNHLITYEGNMYNFPLLVASLSPGKCFLKLLRYGSDPSVFFVNETCPLLVKGFCEGTLVKDHVEEHALSVLNLISFFTTNIFGLSQMVEKVCDNLALKDNEVDRSQWLQLISKLETPQSLQSQSRITIRKHLYSLHSSALEDKILELKIPMKIEEYLIYSDLQ